MNLWFEQILLYLVLVIFHLNIGQVDNQAAAPSRDQTAKLPQALYCPPGAPFGPVHFTKYPPNLAYVEYKLETILIADALARTRETEYIGCEGKWCERLPRLFKDEYNYLPAYFVPMTLPSTPRLDHPLEPTTAAEATSTQMFGAIYITLTGLVDSMVPNSGPWSLLGQSVSYIIKLAPILWWALPAGSAAPHPELPNASTYEWFPDINPPIPALTAEAKIGCMKASNDTPNQCKPRSNNSLPAHQFQFPPKREFQTTPSVWGFLSSVLLYSCPTRMIVYNKANSLNDSLYYH
ncbi:hypothetical protein DSO57_1002648 [Entomophthora muscae]|uniref:Uncharacterized protein n=1 Tax=Entomophthora muscae TaxID=34485 RepID=A0ACC2TKA6_9FUNG|nr:hypothetical protein DSO57_1002648 [Entomophthora muscae]